jgi:hypothetical protein
MRELGLVADRVYDIIALGNIYRIQSISDSREDITNYPGKNLEA